MKKIPHGHSILDDDVKILKQTLRAGGQTAFDIVPAALEKVIREQQWKNHNDRHGNAFLSFEAFVTHPGYWGLGTTIDELRHYCRKRSDVVELMLREMEPGATHAQAGAQGGRGRKAGDNVTSFKRGNSALYTLKRLKRDRRDLFEQVLGGTMSANEAAIEAGWRSKPTTLTQIMKLLPKLTPSERQQLRAALDEMMKPPERATADKRVVFAPEVEA